MKKSGNNNETISEYIAEFAQFAKKVNLTKTSAVKFYQKAGILTKSGNLTRNYRQSAKNAVK